MNRHEKVQMLHTTSCQLQLPTRAIERKGNPTREVAAAAFLPEATAYHSDLTIEHQAIELASLANSSVRWAASWGIRVLPRAWSYKHLCLSSQDCSGCGSEPLLLMQATVRRRAWSSRRSGSAADDVTRIFRCSIVRRPSSGCDGTSSRRILRSSQSVCGGGGPTLV